MAAAASTAVLDTPCRRQQPVRLEKLWLSASSASVYGSVSVLNIAFAKAVSCRFTFDDWETVLEIAADYYDKVLPRVCDQGHDRFQFCITLPDESSHLEKSMRFCMRYIVNASELWDNNGGADFLLHFKEWRAAEHVPPALVRQTTPVGHKLPVGGCLTSRRPGFDMQRQCTLPMHWLSCAGLPVKMPVENNSHTNTVPLSTVVL
ncbi:hypothetical protein SPI_01421 [Niveomyces insectorum RCEF 264]|uniref:CBM21 domain-containing protein n=1 Tax=Niveomyces insectorum RCEF 264 TaxID=1081102 RepID=A0A167YYD7_9HYPO|nr:hypothetical protein SPI_01421 [Niveomyces insectorum RCEF 264]